MRYLALIALVAIAGCENLGLVQHPRLESSIGAANAADLLPTDPPEPLRRTGDEGKKK